MSHKEELLTRIMRHLMLHTSFTENLGLLNGKMGVAIFFYKYARHTGEKRYSDFAGELVDEIYKEIHSDYPRDFKDGLAGICWGMEYIIRNGFADADADEVLEDLDSQILERDVRRVKDISLETGLEGLAHYVMARCSARKILRIDDGYITELIDSMCRNGADQGLIIHLDNLLSKRKVDYEFNLIDRVAAKSKYKETSLFDKPVLGISGNGLAGVAIKLMNQNRNVFNLHHPD